MSKGLRINRKPRVRAPREPDLSSTSGARRYLREVQRGGDEAKIAAAEKQVADSHPDMLIHRTIGG